MTNKIKEVNMASEDITNLNLVQKLAGIRKMVEVIRKNKSGFNYKYVSEDEILARVTAGMDKHHVLLYPGIVPQTAEVSPYNYTKIKNAKDGKKIEESVNEVLVKADMTFTWINLDNPEDTLVVPWVIVGQQSDASQAVGSGLSYLHRYFLLKFFQIATPDDDPDNWRSKKLQAAEEEERAVVSAMIDEIDELVSNHLNAIQDEEQLKDARAKLTDVIKKYVKDSKGKPSGNYRIVTNTKIATDVLEAVKKFVGGNEE
ncbi:hypothetical protein D3Z52_02220 [Clostridiaceae bacterium]|nr:hypothetical protein [Clostridiaceae bacterium]